MIRAVCFDWFNTLARYEPPRETVLSRAFAEFGIHIEPDRITRGMLLADGEYFEENAVSPISKRPPDEQARIFTQYQERVLAEAGVKYKGDRSIFPRIMLRGRELSRSLSFGLFDDVKPSLEALKAGGFTLGIVTNLERDMGPICRDMGIDVCIDFTVTSQEVGADKPRPPIFLAALERAGTTASETAYVGDQYKVDIVGAKGVGMRAILIDRIDLYDDIDCPRIHTLTELPDYFKKNP